MYPESSATEHRCDTAGPVTFRNNNAVVHCSICGRALIFLVYILTSCLASFADVESLPEMVGTPRPWITEHSRARSGRGLWSLQDETTIFAKPYSGNFDTLFPRKEVKYEPFCWTPVCVLFALSFICYVLSKNVDEPEKTDYDVYQSCLELVDDDHTRLEMARVALFEDRLCDAADQLEEIRGKPFEATTSVRDVVEAEIALLEQHCLDYESKRHSAHQKPALRHKEQFRAFLERESAGTGLTAHTTRFYVDVVPQLATMHHMEADELYVHLVRLSNGYCTRHELDHVAQFTFERLMMQYCADLHINIERPFRFVSSS